MAFCHPDGDWRAKDAAHTIAQSAPLFLRSPHPRATVATSLYPGVRAVMDPYVRRKIPCILVECGFASNKPDRSYLLTRPGMQAVANAIEAGAIEFWRLSEVKYAP